MYKGSDTVLGWHSYAGDVHPRTLEVSVPCLKNMLISCVSLHVRYKGEKFPKDPVIKGTLWLPFDIPFR